MDISRQTMLSIALLTISMSAWIPWVLNVNVTNFPLDEHGNLKVSSGVTSEVITLASDYNMSWIEGRRGHTSFTADVAEYNEVVVYASFKNWTTEGDCHVGLVFSVDGIGIYAWTEDEFRWGSWEVYMPYRFPSSRSYLYHIRGTEARLYIEFYPSDYSNNPAGWILVSISLYLRN
ncbi:hypothetical protein GTO27_03950 [Candidatus Bathyarchaeota archaeon]|nr:hypothetical protein [Candidatus Bathyarchaeota archaeon]